MRAMFDRIAGFYDVMNSVMTAGLHHRWRARAADLARLRPGDRALDVATGTGDLALELARRVRPGGRGRGSDFSRGDARARARQGGGRRALDCEWGNALELPYADAALRRRDRRLRRAQLLRPRARPGRDGARGAARRARRGARDHDAAAKPPLSTFYRSGSTASCRSSGGSPATPTPTRTCRSSVKRFPGPRGARRP